VQRLSGISAAITSVLARLYRMGRSTESQ